MTSTVTVERHNDIGAVLGSRHRRGIAEDGAQVEDVLLGRATLGERAALPARDECWQIEGGWHVSDSIAASGDGTIILLTRAVKSVQNRGRCTGGIILVNGERQEDELMDTRRDTPETNQATQQRMVEQARQIPGVAEAMAAYARLAPYTAISVATPQLTMKVGYSTGGNR